MRVFLVCFIALCLATPLAKPLHSQNGFLPETLTQITLDNAHVVEQLTVIVLDGQDLIKADRPDLKYVSQTPPGSDHWMTSVAFSDDGTYLGAGSYDSSVRVWNTRTSQRILTLLGHRDIVFDVVFSPTGLLIASGSGAYNSNDDFSVRLWKLETEMQVALLTGHRYTISRLSFNPNGTILASASLDGTIRLWNTLTGKLLRTIRASEEWISSVQFDSTGNRLLSAGNDNLVKLWDAESGDLLRTMPHEDWVLDARFSPDQSIIASASRDRTVRLWNAETGALHAIYQITTDEEDEDGFPIIPGRVAFSPTGKLLAVTVGTTIELWDTENEAKLAVLNGHTESIDDVDFNADGTLLASASFDGTIRFWGVPQS